ncbi:hypothetical protein H0H92_014557, partial [Tricholoma furcatifolium]
RHRARRDAEAQEFGHHPVREKVAAAHVHSAPAIPTGITREEFPVGGNAFIAKHAKLEDQGWSFKTLKEALDAGYELIQWDGKYVRLLVTLSSL